MLFDWLYSRRRSRGGFHGAKDVLTDRNSINDRFYDVRRHTFDVETGKPNLFVSGYTNQIVPNLWDR